MKRLGNASNSILDQLSTLSQGKESLEEFAEEVRRLADRAYKGADRQVAESTAVYTFLTGIKNRCWISGTK